MKGKKLEENRTFSGQGRLTDVIIDRIENTTVKRFVIT